MEQHLSEILLADDEALSLCDLTTNEHQDPEENHPQQPYSDDQELDFAFGATAGSNSPESYNMCTADELFFRGQILPLRHSVTLPSRFTTRTREFTRSVSFSRSEPVSVASSRSSSSRSSTSGSEFNRNPFHSHPSPTPQIRTRTRHSYPIASSKWRLMQLGPLKTKEIGLADLKNRSERRDGKVKIENENENVKMKKILSFAGCKCNGNVVESTVRSRMLMVKATGLTEKEKETGLGTSKESNVGQREHAVSSHRTSQWLKQLFHQ